MKLSDLIAAGQKLTPLVGDAEVVLEDIDSGAKSVIHALSVDLSPSGDAASSAVTVKHGAAPEEPSAPEQATEASPADTPAP